MSEKIVNIKVGVLGSIVWITGIVLAQGFWSTFFAVIFPFWAWYVVIRYFLIYFGIL